MTRRTLLTCIFMLSAVAVCGQRWQIAPDGRGIVWKVGSDIPHDDHIEMSGERMAFVLRWGVDSRGAFRQERSLVFPLLRTLPNNTHASLMYRMAADIPSLLGVNGLALQDERVGQVAIDGALEVRSLWGVGKMNVGSARDMKPEPVVEMTRTIFPSRTLPLMCERYMLRNVGAKPLTVSVPEFSQVITTDPAKGVTGSYVVRGDIAGSGTFTPKRSCVRWKKSTRTVHTASQSRKESIWIRMSRRQSWTTNRRMSRRDSQSRQSQKRRLENRKPRQNRRTRK